MYDQCRTGAVVHGVISGKSFQKDSAHCNLWMHVYYDCIIRIPDVFVHSALQSYFFTAFCAVDACRDRYSSDRYSGTDLCE